MNAPLQTSQVGNDYVLDTVFPFQPFNLASSTLSY